MFGKEEYCFICKKLMYPDELVNGLNLDRWHKSCDTDGSAFKRAAIKQGIYCKNCAKPIKEGDVFAVFGGMEKAHFDCGRQAAPDPPQSEHERRMVFAREIAAGAWCGEKTSSTIMDTDLAEEFARILVKEMYEPHLGCATTLRIAEELRSRLEDVRNARVLRDILSKFIESADIDVLNYTTIGEPELKHDPYCDCGVCAFCNGDEDQFGNPRKTKISTGCAHAVPKGKNCVYCDADLSELKQPFMPRTPEPEIALKLRFVLLTNSVTVEVIKQNFPKGCQFETSFKTSNGWTFALHGLHYGAPGFSGYDKALKLAMQYVCDTKSTARSFDFQEFQQDLTEFAETGAFHGNEKPVDRIEAEGSGARFYYEGGNSPIFPLTRPERLQEIVGRSYRIYDPKPRFSHEWKKVSPRDFPSNRELDVIKTPYDDIATLNDATNHVKIICADYFIKAQLDLPEIYEFTMTTNPD